MTQLANAAMLHEHTTCCWQSDGLTVCSWNVRAEGLTKAGFIEGPVNSAPVVTNAMVATKGLQYARYLFFAPEAVQSLYLSHLAYHEKRKAGRISLCSDLQ